MVAGVLRCVLEETKVCEQRRLVPGRSPTVGTPTQMIIGDELLQSRPAVPMLVRRSAERMPRGPSSMGELTGKPPPYEPGASAMGVLAPEHGPSLAG